jgi:hypothetical protein
MYESKEAIGQLLVDSAEKLVASQPNRDGLEKMISAFADFKRGVTFASTGRYATPADLLEPLEHKRDVCDRLICLYKGKKMLKRQIEAVVSVLLYVDGWAEPFMETDVPELIALASDVLASAPEVPTSDNAKDSSVPPSATKSHISAESCFAHATDAEKDELTALRRTLDLLENSRRKIKELDYSAAGTAEMAIDAFEDFCRAVVQVVQSRTKQDDQVLEKLEPKREILEFLVDVSERIRKYRTRVASVLIRLLAFESWHVAADNDQSIHAAVKHLISGGGIDTATRPSRVEVKTAAGSQVQLRCAAEAAVARGGIGAVYVRVVSARNLIAADSNGSSDPYVRVFLGQRMKRTHIVANSLNPCWDAAAFVMDAPAMDAVMKVQALDDDVVSSDKLGNLQIKVSDLPTELGNVSAWHALSDTPHGELELELLLVLGKQYAQYMQQQRDGHHEHNSFAIGDAVEVLPDGFVEVAWGDGSPGTSVPAFNIRLMADQQVHSDRDLVQAAQASNADAEYERQGTCNQRCTRIVSACAIQ